MQRVVKTVATATAASTGAPGENKAASSSSFSSSSSSSSPAFSSLVVSPPCRSAAGVVSTSSPLALLAHSSSQLQVHSQLQYPHLEKEKVRWIPGNKEEEEKVEGEGKGERSEGKGDGKMVGVSIEDSFEVLRMGLSCVLWDPKAKDTRKEILACGGGNCEYV